MPIAHARLLPPSGRVLGLDLMRAAAVLLVLVSHWSCHIGDWFGLSVPPLADFLGDAGVALFFALSGFLIGRILIGMIGDEATGGPTWHGLRVFLARRALRTLPLYFLWLAVLLLVFPPRHDALPTALRFATLTQNLLAPMPPDYYFAVTWSLTIEEWFYLLFGGALTLLARSIGGPRALGVCLAAFLLAPLALRLAWAERPGMVFFRLDEIAYGVLMAWLSTRGSRVFDHPWSLLAAGAGLVAGSAAAPTLVEAWWVSPLLPSAVVAGGALCLPAALRFDRTAPWFEAPVRWLATRSYALYLVHLTILVDVAETRLWEVGVLPALPCAVLAILAPFPLAELSYRFLEAPMLRLRPRQEARSAPAPAALAAAMG